RAVGSALAHNPVPLVVPCHRVVRSDGLIGQYSMGGPDAKRRVLGSEGLDTAWLEAEAAAGHRYTGSDTTHIVCHPTCRDARRRRLPALQALPAGRARGLTVRTSPAPGTARSGSAGRRDPSRATWSGEPLPRRDGEAVPVRRP